MALRTCASVITRRRRSWYEATTSPAGGATAFATSRSTLLVTSPMRIILMPPAVEPAIAPSAIATTTMAGANSPQSVANSRPATTVNPVPVCAETSTNRPLRTSGSGAR